MHHNTRQRATDCLDDTVTCRRQNTSTSDLLTDWLTGWLTETLSRVDDKIYQPATYWPEDWNAVTCRRQYTLASNWLTDWLTDWDIVTCAPQHTSTSDWLIGWLTHCHVYTTKHFNEVIDGSLHFGEITIISQNVTCDLGVYTAARSLRRPWEVDIGTVSISCCDMLCVVVCRFVKHR